MDTPVKVKPKMKLYGFNNLTKTLSFNIYDICYTRTEEEKKQYIQYIDEVYNADRLTAILTEVSRIIGANILNVAKQDYDPQGASVTILISEEEIEKEDVVMAIESNFSVEYLQGVIHEEEGSPICLIDKISQKGEAEEDKVVDNILLKEVLGKLDKRERQIIMLRYFEDKTQSEIGELLNISQVQVSRIEKKVLHKLKSYIEM